MSIHIDLSPEAQERLKKQKTRSTITSLLISVGVILLLGLTLGLLTIIIPNKEPEVIIAYAAAPQEQETTQDPKVKIQKRQVPTPPASSSAVANVMTTTAPTSISIPDTNQMVSVDAPDFGSSDDFGMGFGFGEESQAQGMMTAFGRVSSGGMTGYLFDMKQDRRGDPTSDFNSNLQEVRKKKYQHSGFKDFYKADVELSFSYLAIDYTSADVGPASFQAEDEIEPRQWFAVYEGTLASTHSKQVRFLGRFDDTILVYLNDKVVFDGSWNGSYSDLHSECNLRGSQAKDYPKIVGRNVCIGDYVNLKAGDNLRIVVAEIPGGRLGGGLFIEEKGVKNPGLKANGEYRYIPFTTNELTDEDITLLEDKNTPIETGNVPYFPIEN